MRWCGILSGIRDFGKGLWHGATGVLTQPIKGAKEEGIVGFGKGIGKGVVGIAAKPLAGTFDLISQTADGIKNTTTYFSDNTRERVRPPRYIGEDHVLTPFSKKKSEGKLTLFNLDDQSHQDEHYLWHLEGQVRGTPHLMRAKLCTALTTSFAHFRARVSCAVVSCAVEKARVTFCCARTRAATSSMPRTRRSPSGSSRSAVSTGAR